MTTPGRNALCPCGSGRKYKRCCGRNSSADSLPVQALTGVTGGAGASAGLGRAHPDTLHANAVKARDERLSLALIRFARREFGDAWIRESAVAYLEGQGENSQIDEPEVPIAMTWALFSAPSPGSTASVARLALANPRQARIDAESIPVLHGQLDAWLGIWEVQRLEPGVGMELTDLLTKETRFVHERTASRSLAHRDTLLARVVDAEGISFITGLFPYVLTPSDAEHLAKQIRRACGVRTRPVDREWLRGPQLQRSLLDGWRRTVHVRSAPPTMTNTDGDPLVLTTDRFDIVGARDDVVARLSSFPGANEPEPEEDGSGDTVFVITKSGNRVHAGWDNTVVGRLVVANRMLRVETNSVRRADRLQKDLMSHLGALVRFRLRGESGADELIARAHTQSRGAPHPSRPAARDPEFVAIERQMREQYMTEWMDQPVPALGGLTPRAAAAGSAASRRELETLLKDFEHVEGRMPAAERLDIDRIRRELLGVFSGAKTRRALNPEER